MLLGGYRTAHFYGAGVYGLLFNNAAEGVDYDFRFRRTITAAAALSNPATPLVSSH